MDSRNLTSHLLDSISVGICIIDKNYTVQFWNDYMEEYTGIDRDGICLKPLSDFFPAFKKEIYRERIDNLFEGWPPVMFSSQLHEPFFFQANQENNRRFQEICISPLTYDPSDDFLAVLTVTDVTDLTFKLGEQNKLYKKVQKELENRKKIQEKLRISENSLRELNATKDKFFSIIAHDLRGPVGSLLSLSELLVKHSSNEDFKEVSNYSYHIHKSAESVYSLLINLLDWSRLQLGKLQLCPETINIDHLIDEIILLHKAAANSKQITLFKEVQTGLQLFADMNMINTVIRNLVSNAIKYTNEKGEIIIKVMPDINEMLFSVSDNGIGIREGDIQKLFTIESDFTRPGTFKEKGTGIGLLLCKEFVEKHLGRIWVESNYGEGSVFYFSIPL